MFFRVEIVPCLLLVVWASPAQSIIRTSCERNVRFENPKKGFVLLNHVILSTVDVKRASDCIVECLQHPSCQSINFKHSANICELNDKTENEDSLTSNIDFVYYGPTKAYKLNCSTSGPGECKNGGTCLPPACLSDEKTCVCQKERAGPTCEEFAPGIAQNVDVEFPRASIEDYVLVNNDQQMESFSVVFWINIVVATLVTPLSYAVDGSNEEVLIVMMKETLIVTIQSDYSKTFYIPPMNDGFWHHIGICWSNKNYAIFVDGTLIYKGDDFGSATPLKKGGYFAIGQTMSAPGKNFKASASFVGKLSQLNIWNRPLTTEEVKAMSNNCSNDVGTIVDWSKVVTLVKGQLITIVPQECKSLRNDENYDIIMSASSQTTTVPTYLIISDNIPSISAFTLVMWVKHSTIFRYLKYVVGTKTTLSIKIFNGVMRLRIMDSITSARIPRYWNERPSYWHHFGTTWSSSSGIWQIFLDGSVVSIITDVSTGVEVPANGIFVFGNKQTSAGLGMSIKDSIDGSLSRVNIWDYVIDGEAIWAMSKGPLFENGNVFAWYGVKNKSVGNMVFEVTPTTLYNSRRETEFRMKFPTKSTLNYATIDDPFKENLMSISSCFWLTMKSIGAAVFVYSTTHDENEFMAYITFSTDKLHFHVHSSKENGLPMLTKASWHFYCVQWRSSDGLVQYYRDGIYEVKANVGKDLVIRTGGVMIIGQEPDGYVTGFQTSQALEGDLMQLNFWQEFLLPDEIQGMACGVININGNLLQWRDMRHNIFGNIEIKERSLPIIPEQPAQKKRDLWCLNLLGEPHYARFTRGRGNTFRWRCQSPKSLLPENMCYNIPLQSIYYATRSELNGVN